MPKSPPAGTSSQSKSSLADKPKKARSKSSSIKNATIEDLETLKDDNITEHGAPKKTVTEYTRIKNCSREWLAELVEERKKLPRRKGDIDPNTLANAFDTIPNRYSAYALELYITHKCINEKARHSTAITIHAAWAKEWDNADGKRYAGEYDFDSKTSKFKGCPARAKSVTDLVKSIRTRDGKEGAAATRNHAEAMVIEDVEAMLSYSKSLHPHGLLSTDTKCKKLGEALKHEMGRAMLTTGYLLWTRNFELCQLKWRHITPGLTGPAPHRSPYIRVFLENRKGWQNKHGWDGPLGSNTYHVYKQDLDALDMYTHLQDWIHTYEAIIGRSLRPDDYLFPHVSSNGTINPRKSLTEKCVQSMLDNFSDGAGINRRYTTHSMRRGGAQYRMMYAPIDERWTIARIRWWGGWAEGESVDTLMKYLLDSLQSYESGHADALAPRPKPKQPQTGLNDTDTSLGVVTKHDLEDIHKSLTSAIESLKLCPASVWTPFSLSTTEDPASTQTPRTHIPIQSTDTAHNYTSAMVGNDGTTHPTISDTSLAATRSVPPVVSNSWFPRRASAMLPQVSPSGEMPAFASEGTYPLSDPSMFVHHNHIENQRSASESDPAMHMNKNTGHTRLPDVHRSQLPKVGLHIPDLSRKDPKAWREAVRQWEEGVPEENIPPLRDWPIANYTGVNRERFGVKRMERKVLADEFERLGRKEAVFERHYGHLRGIRAVIAEIKSKNGTVKRRRSKNGSPEERGAYE